MLTVTLSGVLEDDCVIKTDKNEHKYIRFRVICDEPDFKGKPSVTIVRCYCYNMKYSDLKKNDIVFLSGSFKFTQYGGKIEADVYVKDIAMGKTSEK